MAGVRMGTFSGARVYLSRSLVPPEMFDALHDALKLNGAEVLLCCDPSRNSPNDYHIISSPDHEKFQDLKAKGCNLLGPHCILSCAKERRSFPKQGYTCCLAMDGVKILASGFENEEKVRITQLVHAMGGVLCSKTSLDVSFVIVKNVLAAKYKWALNVLKKPIVNLSWLNQCWKEHHLVPQEPYRIPPFAGLTISATRIPLDERKEIERLILQNGGQYSGDLTKKCTHLVSDAPEGDKYMVAKRWGHIHIVTRRWVDLSVGRKACLDEEHYPVNRSSVSHPTIKNRLKEQYSQDWSNQSSQCGPTDGNMEVCSQKISYTCSDATVISESNKTPELPINNDVKIDQPVAEDSEDEDSDLYLSNCRILLLGFEEKELRRLINLIRKGGGSRHMLLSEKLTHIIVGAPSEIEKKEVRQLAAWGVINVVKHVWLEDCDLAKKELPVSQRHIISDLLLPKADAIFSSKVSSVSMIDLKKEKSFTTLPRVTMGQGHIEKNCEEGFAFEKVRGKASSFGPELQESCFSDSLVKAKQKSQLLADNAKGKSNCSLPVDSENVNAQGASLNIFKGHTFRFSRSFPIERRADIIDWIGTGGGTIVGDNQSARFVIECHGIVQSHACSSQSTVVSSHWIRSCLEEGVIQDISSHILYTPLCCHIPFPGFEGFRFCISQYEMKERQLLRNLCFTLGSKCTEKLSKKVTHLLCKFTSGPKYEAACKWGIQSVTTEWIYECIRQDAIVSLDLFRPRAATVKDREGGLCISSQYPTQAAHLISGCLPSQVLTELESPLTSSKHRIEFGNDASYEEPGFSRSVSKKSKFFKADCAEILSMEDIAGAPIPVPDMAAAIEDLLAQSNKIQDLRLPKENVCNKSAFSPDHYLEHADSGPTSRISNHWTSRAEKDFKLGNHSGMDATLRKFDAFSETQTESQVVGYEEDLSGRQKIIDRVRSQSLTLTPDGQNVL